MGGFGGTGKHNFTTLEQKNLGSIFSTGLIFSELANQVNSVRIGTSSASGGNIVTLEGSVDGTTWQNLGSIVGNGITLFDTQAFNNIRIVCSTYGGTPFNCSWKLEDHPAATFLQDKDGNQLNVNPDGSINAVVTGITIENVYVDLTAFGPTPDSVLSAGSEDGTTTGVRHIIKVKADGTTLVEDTAALAALATANASLSSIDAGIPASLGQQTMADSMPVVLASNQPPIPVSLSDEPVKISGTENGQPGGTEFTFVNNVRSQILAAKDRVQDITYADFGTKNQRVTQIDYTATSIGSGAGFTARKTLSYTLVGNRYRRDSIIWTLI